MKEDIVNNKEKEYFQKKEINISSIENNYNNKLIHKNIIIIIN